MAPSHLHRRSWGGGRGGLGPPLEKLVSLAGQKLDPGRTDMGAWQVSVTFFGWFLPYFPVFPPLLPVLQPFIFHFCPLADSLVEKLGTAAWQNTCPPGRKKFWQEAIEFWQDEVVGPPSKMTQIRL